MMSGRKVVSTLANKIIIWSILASLFVWNTREVHAQVSVGAPSVCLIESSTGQIIYEKNANERKSPASITKIMTLLLTFDALKAGNVDLRDDVIVSEHASSMGGSQVYLAEGEIQSLETMIKCIAVASGNDASVAVAEHIAGSEDAFVDQMNEKAKALGLNDTHFEDCCGLSDSDNHYSSARDIAMLSRELTTKHPEIFEYTKIWMEDITHETRQGTTKFTLTSTNKLLKQYAYTTGLKTGSTSKALYCISATASKDGVDLIAVVMGAPDYKTRFQDAQTLFTYGFGVCDLYIDENQDSLADIRVKNAKEETVSIRFGSAFRYLDTTGKKTDRIEKTIELPEFVEAPLTEGDTVGVAVYSLEGKEIGKVPIIVARDVEKASYLDYFVKVILQFLL